MDRVGKRRKNDAAEDLPKISPMDVRGYDLGGDAADRHDELFAQGALEEYERKMKRARRL